MTDAKNTDEEARSMVYLNELERQVVEQAGIKEFIEATLSDAGQLRYILDQDNRMFETHDVLVDVDCQFDRRGQVGFHKDSRGTTAFINLTFSNEKTMTGPEHYEDLLGAPGLEQSLPPEVQTDIMGRREAVKKAGGDDMYEIKSSTLPPYGRVSSSDPNLYHSTPYFAHRMRVDPSENRPLAMIETILRYDKKNLRKS